MISLSILLLLTLTLTTTHAAIPFFRLNNSAVPNLMMPAIGVGTGGYGFNPAVGWGGYPECFDEPSGCGDYTVRTLTTWLDLGGRRLDCANSYGNSKAVGRALAATTVPRSEIFILEKVGPGPDDIPLGYNDTLVQFAQLLMDLGTDYVDLLLIHWPAQNVPLSSDPYCRQGSPMHDETQCRLSTWKAMLQIFNSGGAKAIGVSNYNTSHLQEIVDAGLPLPAYNQCPFHLYRSSTHRALRDYCASHGILFGGYSPLGVPDYHTFPIEGTGMAFTPMQDPNVMKIAAAHGMTPAQVLIQWQWAIGVPVNPRSQNVDHMKENLNAYSYTLSADEISLLNGAPQDQCTLDSSFYECSNSTSQVSTKLW